MSEAPFRLPGVGLTPRAPGPLRHPLPETAEFRTLGVTLHAETPDDLAFIRRLYAAGRAAEMTMLHWDRDTKRDFVERQFEYQYRHHSAHYQPGDFAVIRLNGEPVGRIYLYWNDFARDCRLFELSLMPERRDRGIGSAVLSALLTRAGGLGYGVSLHVEPISPARRLYARFGFVAAGNELESGSIQMRWNDGPTRPALRLTD